MGNNQYAKIFKKYGPKILKRLDLLKGQYEHFIDGIQLDKSSVYLPIDLLIDVVRNYYVDLDRMKDFHNIKVANSVKIAAYQTAWLLRIRPIQILNIESNRKKKSRYILLNEHFAFHTMVCQLYNSSVLTNQDITKWNTFVDQLIYHFRFRQSDAQSIELMLLALGVSPVYPALDSAR